jgi:hypothetical protein
MHAAVESVRSRDLVFDGNLTNSRIESLPSVQKRLCPGAVATVESGWQYSLLYKAQRSGDFIWKLVRGCFQPNISMFWLLCCEVAGHSPSLAFQAASNS